MTHVYCPTQTQSHGNTGDRVFEGAQFAVVSPLGTQQWPE